MKRLVSRVGSVAWAARVAGLVLWTAMGWAPRLVEGQEIAAQDSPLATLHVYTNLVQVPVLVLSARRQGMKPLNAGEFSVSLDSGPLFQPTHVRLEGDDAISLAIVLDVGGAQSELMPTMNKAIASLGPRTLTPADEVTTYALDCALIRSSHDVPADAARMKASVEAALKPWMDRRRQRGVRDCAQGIHLWDALKYVTEQLRERRGHRVILAVTDGNDRGSRTTWSQLRELAQASGVAIFGLGYEPLLPSGGHMPAKENPLNVMCELTGGMVLTGNRGSLTQALVRFTQLVRGRYVVEFPRPLNATVGQHGIEVTIAKQGDAFIRPAGAAFPLPDPKIVADPATLPPDPTHAPVMGTRRVLPPR